MEYKTAIYAAATTAGILLGGSAFADGPDASATPRVSRPGVYSGYSPEQFDGWVPSSEYVPVRDGARLAVTIYRPSAKGIATDERLPVLFSFTPYLARRIDADGRIVGTVEGHNRGRPFVELTRYGYVVAVADVRGKGSSFGARAAYADRMEGEDGYDLVEWLATRPWSDGKVGMFGCSYVGGTQWSTARNLPPHLMAIFPQAGQFDSYRNVRRGGIAGQFNTRPVPLEEDLPSAPVDGDVDGKLKAAALEEHRQNGQMMDMVAQLAFRDDHTRVDVEYWPLSSPYPKMAEIKAAGISIYNWGNWRDELADQSLIAFENMRQGPGMSKLLLGPGLHCDTDSIDSFAEHLRFFDHVLKGVDNGIDREPPIAFKTVGVPDEQAWRFTASLPLAGQARERLYLAPPGALVADRPRAALDRYQVTYNVGCAAPGLTPTPGAPTTSEQNRVAGYDLPPPSAWPCLNAQIAKTYLTVPMPEDKWLSGFSVVGLTLASTSRDAFVFGFLEDVAPDGKAALIAHGRLLASQRKLSDPPYDNLGLPWHSGLRRDSEPLEPGKPVALRFELSPISNVVAKGHRLRLSFTGADIRQRRLASIAMLPPPQWTIITGGSDASYLDLTLVPLAQLFRNTRAIREPTVAASGGQP